MGSAGWANLALQTVGRSLLSEVIAQVGAKLDMPPSMIALAQQAAAGGVGVPVSLDQAINTLGQSLGATMTEIGAAQREGRTVMERMVESTLAKARGEDEEGATVTGSQSRLMKLAMAMGKLLDTKMDQMIDVASAMDKVGKTPGDKVDVADLGIEGINFGTDKVGQGTLSGMMQALSQELGQISQALSTTLKSIGESNSTLAHKG